MIFNELSKEVIENDYFLSLYNKLSINISNLVFKQNTKEILTEKEFVHLLRFSDILSNSSSEEYRNLAYKIISLLNTQYHINPIFKTYAVAILNELGNFPAINYLNYKIELPFERSLNMEIKKEVQKIPHSSDKVFTDSQYKLFKQLLDSNVYSFSGPTSMGKSFIIKMFISEILNEKKFGNFCIIVPTRALINQFSIELNNELKQLILEKEYNIVTSSDISKLCIYPGNNYIFVFTPERLINYLSNDKNPKINYLFVDEAHKLAVRNDYRSITLYVSIDRCIRKNRNVNIYFSSPNVSNPEIFLKLFDKDYKKCYKTTESPVAQNLYFVDLINKKVKYKDKYTDITFEPELLKSSKSSNDIIYSLGNGNSNVIYCSSVVKAISKAKDFVHTLVHKNIEIDSKEKEELKKAEQVVREFIHEDYYLIECLEYGVAFHFGNLPYNVRNRIEDLFKRGIIKYLFCTSTLLEGVNLPAKNIFILNNKKGTKNMEEIDFWNLAGRAGRLNYELYGNIFCIRESERDWLNIDVLDNKDNIKLESDIISETNKNLDKIKSLIKSGDCESKSQTEKEVLSYISNIISIDSLEPNKSPLISKLIDNKEVLECAKEKMRGINIPFEILTSNKFILVEQQKKVYEYVLNNYRTSERVIFPKNVDYKNCLSILNKLYELYNWKDKERELRNKNSLKYYAMLMSKWINGIPLKNIINDSINYCYANKSEIYVFKNNVRVKEVFDKHNKLHINTKINSTIEDIEEILRYLFEKYFDHYYSILNYILGEEKSGLNWSSFLEYGSRNTIIIELQNMGISRYAAHYIYENYGGCLEIKSGRLSGIDKNKLLNQVDKDSIVYEEINNILI
jgi:POLQ-like helicase